MSRCALMNELEDRRHEQKRRDGRAGEAANHRAAERGVQIAAKRDGRLPMIIASAVMRTGRKRVKPASPRPSRHQRLPQADRARN